MSNILAIETSCDETALCLMNSTGALGKNMQINILGNALYSQTTLHNKYGGVFPSLAKREHQRNLVPLLEKVLEQANSTIIKQVKIVNNNAGALTSILEREPELHLQFIDFISKNKDAKFAQIDAIAVTQGPGLSPALWSGINFARALSYIFNIPLIPIDHMEGHIFSALLEPQEQEEQMECYKLSNIKFPALCLLISGGHTELVVMQRWFDYKIVGQTRDDAVGEAFDKVARMLDLPYPGGPHISELAQRARLRTEEATIIKQKIELPRPMLHSANYDFSLSGLKTAVLYFIKKSGLDMTKHENIEVKMAIAKEFEDAVAEVLVKKTIEAMLEYEAETLILGGGVSANKYIREQFTNALFSKIPQARLVVPELCLTGDNAVMIATSAIVRASQYGMEIYQINPDIQAQGNLRLDKKAQ